MNTPKENLEGLKDYLKRLTFARVGNVISKDEDLIAFVDKSGMTSWSDDPDFLRRRNEFTPAEWKKTGGKSYKYYFGFANNIYFQSKTQSDDSGFSGLGVSTNQNRLEPLPIGTWIVGRLDPKASKPRFAKWAICTFQEKLFVDFMLGKRKFSTSRLSWMEQISTLFTNEEVETNHLVNMAVLLIIRDLEYYLDQRKLDGGIYVDHQVLRVCREYDLELWDEYRVKALLQGKFSTLIPEPAKKDLALT